MALTWKGKYGEEQEAPLWRRIYDKATAAAAYAIAEGGSGASGTSGKDCNVCDKEGKKIAKAKQVRKRRNSK
jgi:hypothetical protein